MVVARTRDSLEELKNISSSHVRVLTGDLADFSIAKKATSLAITEFGRLDGLVINHAVFPPATKIADSRIDDWKQHFDVNLFSAVTLVSCSGQ